MTETSSIPSLSSYLIIGAGPCGLAAARALSENGILYDHVEADNGVGGNWYHGVYKSVYTDSCKEAMEYPEFPMPENYPDFLSAEQMLEYFRAYASNYKLLPRIRFNTKVVWLAAIENNRWQATFKNGDVFDYEGVIICNGHHWDKQYPEYLGSFTGVVLHSKEYKDPSQLANQRVLVIGAGNSAADIACEAARVGVSSTISFRDSPWIFPKSFMGVPLGRVKLRLSPGIFQPFLIKLLLRLSFGDHAQYKIPQPNHKPLTKHPTVSEELPYYLKHGRIAVKGEIKSFSDQSVIFMDGSEGQYDLIITATGFKLSFPFLPDSLTRTDGKNLQCVGYCVYPDYRGLYFLGWPQVRGGVGSLASALSGKIVDMIRLERETGCSAGKVLMVMGNKISSTHLYGAKELFLWVKRHSFERMLSAAKKIKLPHQNITTTRILPENHGDQVVF